MCTLRPLIFGPKKKKFTGGRKKLDNGELYDLYTSPTIINVSKIEENEAFRACSTHGIVE
jgi:hypothetical protein